MHGLVIAVVAGAAGTAVRYIVRRLMNGKGF